jgi:hypothetical protein
MQVERNLEWPRAWTRSPQPRNGRNREQQHQRNADGVGAREPRHLAAACEHDDNHCGGRGIDRGRRRSESRMQR